MKLRDWLDVWPAIWRMIFAVIPALGMSIGWGCAAIGDLIFGAVPRSKAKYLEW